MNQLKIPRSAEIGVEKILSLAQDNFNDLISAFQEIPITLNPQKITEFLSTRSSINREDINRIVGTLLPLYSFRETLKGKDKDSFLDDLTESAFENKNINIQNKIKDEIKTILSLVMDIKKLFIISKTLVIINENKLNYKESKVITDIRPIFSNDISEEPVAAAIVFQMLIKHTTSESEGDFYVSMDINDIDELILNLERAKQKAITLSKTLEKTEIINVDFK